MIYEFIAINGKGYSIVFVLVCMVVIAINQYKDEAFAVLEAMNLLLAISGTIGLILFFGKIPTNQSQDYERFAFQNRLFGPYWWSFWLLFVSTNIIPLVFWFKRYRRSVWISIITLFGLNDGLAIRATTFLYQDHLPSSWSMDYKIDNQVLDLILYVGMVALTYIIMKRIRSKKYA